MSVSADEAAAVAAIRQARERTMAARTARIRSDSVEIGPAGDARHSAASAGVVDFVHPATHESKQIRRTSTGRKRRPRMPLRARLGVIPMLVPAWLEWRRMSASEKEDLNEFFQGLWEPHERIWTPEATYEPVDGGRRWLKSASLKGPLHFLEPLDGEAGGVRLVGSGVIRQAPCREYRIEAARPVSVWLDSEGRVRQIVEHGDSWRRTTELWDFGGPAAIELPAEAIVVTSDDDASDPGARPPSPFDTDTPLG